MRITSVQQTFIFTKAPSLTTAPFDLSPVGYPKSKKKLYLIPLTTEALLLQYSGFRIVHMDGFSSCK